MIEGAQFFTPRPLFFYTPLKNALILPFLRNLYIIGAVNLPQGKSIFKIAVNDIINH